MDNFCPAAKSFEQSGPDASRSVHVSPTHNFWPWHWFRGWLTRTKIVILYIAKSSIQLFIWYGDASLGIHDTLPYNIWPYFHGWTILNWTLFMFNVYLRSCKTYSHNIWYADECYADASLGAHVSLAYPMWPSHHFRGWMIVPPSAALFIINWISCEVKT